MLLGILQLYAENKLEENRLCKHNYRRITKLRVDISLRSFCGT